MNGDKSKKYYEYLLTTDANVAMSYESFMSTLKDDEKREKYYNYLKDRGIKTAPTFESFTTTLMGDGGASVPFFEDSSEPSVGDTTTLSEDSSQQLEKDTRTPIEKINDAVKLSAAPKEERDIKQALARGFDWGEKEEAEVLTEEEYKNKTQEKVDGDLGAALGRRLQVGTEKLVANIYRTPEFLYDVGANGYNLLLEAQDKVTGVESAKLPTSTELGEKLDISNKLAEGLEHHAETLREVDSKYDKEIWESIKQGNWGDAAAATSVSISESLPYTLAILLGGAGGAGMAGTFAGTTAVMGAGRKEELLDREDLSETQKNANAMMYGAAEAMEVLFGAGAAGRTINTIAKKQGVPKAKEFALDVYDRFIKDNPAIMPFTEGGQEWITKYMQNLSDIYINGDDVSPFEGTTDAFIVGTVMGTGFTGIGQAVKAVSKMEEGDVKGEFTPKFTQEELTSMEEVANDEQKYNTLMRDIDGKVERGEITQKEAQILKDNTHNTLSAIRKIPNNLTSEQKNQALSLIKEKQQLELQAEGKDDALVFPQKERAQQIDEELTNIVTDGRKETKETEEGTVRDKQEAKSEDKAEGQEQLQSEEVTTQEYGDKDVSTIDGVQEKDDVQVQDEVEKPSQEAQEVAQQHGYKTPIHAVRSVNKRLGKEYTTIEEIPAEEIKRASEERLGITEVQSRLNEAIQDKSPKEAKREVKKLTDKAVPRGTALSRIIKKTIDKHSGEKLETLTEAIAELIQKNEVSQNKSKIERLLKDVRSKARKGKFTNIAQEVSEIEKFDWRKIKDTKLQEDLITTLNNLSKQGVAKFDEAQIKEIKERLDIEVGERQPRKIRRTNKGLNESIDKLKTPENRRQAIQQQSNITRIYNAAEEALLIEKITPEQHQDITEKLDKAQAELNNSQQELARELNEEANNLSKEVPVKDFPPELRDDIQNFIKAPVREDLKHAQIRNDIAVDLLNGYAPMKEMQDYVTDAVSEADATKVGKEVQEKAKERDTPLQKALNENPILKVLSPQFLKKKGLNREGLDRAVYDLKLVDWSMWDDFFGTGKAESVFKTFIAPIEQAMSKDFNESIKDYTKYLDTAYGTKLEFTPSKKFERGKKKILMAMQQGYWNEERGGADYWQEVLNKDLYKSKKEVDELQEMYDEMPKETATNEEGEEITRIDADKYLNSLKGREKKVYDWIVNNNEKYNDKSEVANMRRGDKYVPVNPKYYFPNLRQDFDFNNEDPEGFVNRALAGETNLPPKMVSDRGKLRTSNRPAALNLNMDYLIRDQIFQTNRQFYVEQPLRTSIKGIQKLPNKVDNKKAKTYLRALNDAVKSRVQREYSYDGSKGMKSLNNIISAMYQNALVGIVRLPVEAVAETLRSLPETDIRQLKEGVKLGATSLSAKVKGQGSPIQVIMEETGSPFLNNLFYESNTERLRESRRLGKTIGGKAVKSIGRLSSNIMSAPDDATFGIIWVPQFLAEFNRQNGSPLDIKELSSNPEAYVKENFNNIKKAASFADAKTERVKGAKTKAGKREIIKLLPLKGATVDSNTWYGRVLTILQNFAFLEQYNLMRNARETVYGENKSRKQASAAFISALVSGTWYGWATAMGYALSNDDEEEIERLSSPEGVFDSFISNVSFLTTGRYGNIGKTILLIGAGAYAQTIKKSGELSSKEKKAKLKELEEFTRNRYFAMPIELSGYKSESDIMNSLFPFMNRITQVIGNPTEEITEITVKLAEGKDLTEDEKEVLALLEAFNDLQKLILMFNGVQIPFQKEVDKYFRDQGRKDKKQANKRPTLKY